MQSPAKLLAALGVAACLVGCGDAFPTEHAPLGAAGCELDAERTDSGLFVEHRSSGGIAGAIRHQLLLDDGTVIALDHEGEEQERTFADGVNGLRDALENSGIFDLDQGCYRLENTISDDSTSELTVHRGAETFRFSADSGAPDELDDALAAVRAHVDAAVPVAE